MEQDNLKTNQILKPAEVAKFFGVSKATIMRWRTLGLPYIKLSSKSFFLDSDVYDFALSKRIDPKKG